jgi:probable HAF family extracellular repeat protein
MQTLWITIRLVILVAGFLILLSVAATAQTATRLGAVQPRSTEALQSQSTQGQQHTFKFIPIDYPGASATRAMGINAQGVIVGSFDDSVATHAFLLRDGQFTAFDVPGATITQAKCINAREEIVGYFFDADFNLHGFYFYRRHFKTIDIPFSSETRAEGINDAGAISGEYVDQDGNEHGYLLHEDKFETFDVPNSFSTDIWMVTNDGWFAGDFSDPVTVLAYLRTRRGNYLTLAYPGAAADAARSINDRHEVVGRWDDHSVPPVELFCTTQCHGFYWSDGEFQSIDVPGATSTVALGINNRGQIVGRFVDSAGNDHGFVTKQGARNILPGNQNGLAPLDLEENEP